MNWDGFAGRSCAISAATAIRSCSRKKATAADRTTQCSCAIPMDRRQLALAKQMPRPSRPTRNGLITRAAKGGPLLLVPTGAGESRQLTHDTVSYNGVRFLPDGKRLLASGIEAGHGRRDYLIDLSNGDSKPLTPEGVAGLGLSPDGRTAAVLGPDGKWGVWPIDGGGGMRNIPGLDSSLRVTGWSTDGKSVYVSSSRSEQTARSTRWTLQPGRGAMENLRCRRWRRHH